MMEYKGYTGVFEYDPEEDYFYGRVINSEAVVEFGGKSTEELRKSLEESVDLYLEMCAEKGIEPERPFSGDLRVRLGPELHRQIAGAAAAAGTSMNRWIKRTLESGLNTR